MAVESSKTQGDVPTRWVELIVALLVVAGGLVAMIDSVRVGIAWGDDGPKAGYFPFYIGCILAVAGAWIAVRTVIAWKKTADQVFVTQEQLKPVLQMLLPTIVYVAFVWLIGIYVASAIYIAAFMVWQGKFKPWVVAVASLGVPAALFFLFEIWFLVPLPKGPLERMLGY